ncbi:hypothetical protein Poli38472_007740 [Pythium oligandrum]|uniref:Uncharacterized protein n=1 Tax=Pythium oligandrum TaxID=41045 RepID=A0A8K1FRZ8_PYTOL|nr:hypothetical protein Poli38472_007740 [Pythium oligandrum]|eukprot:TMW68068.1 hypothetical protein Poli38472_007740 [Pythium oligandrum]
MMTRTLSGCLVTTVKSSGVGISRLWDRFQVELHGRFSIQRIEELREYYVQVHWMRVLGVCLLTPVPALAVITLADCIPLAPPTAGRDANYVYWVRLIPVVWILVGGAVQHFRCCLPGLPMSHGELAFIALLATLAGTGLAYATSCFVGFPVPFNLVVQSFAILPVLIVAIRMLWRKSLREKPSLRAELRQQMLVLVGECVMTYVYPLYLFAILTMPALSQSAFTLMLPIIKMGVKNYFSRTLRRLDDLKPAFIVFNVDVFSAIYIANCLQATKSWRNTMIIMLIDIVQAAISMYDVHVVLIEINTIVRVDLFDGSLLDLCVQAAANPQARQELDRRVASASSTQKKLVSGRLSSSAIKPIVIARPNSTQSKSPLVTNLPDSELDAKLRPSECVRLAEKITRVLYIAEFFLLIEFAEVMVPVVYGIYLLAMSHLPNRAYYPQLSSLDEEELAHSVSAVMINAGLEFASILVTGWYLGRQLKLSSLRLLAFALEYQPALIHSSMTMWLSYVIQQSLVHSGVDFTLSFTWLHGG